MIDSNDSELDDAPPFYYEALVLAGGRGSRMAGRDKGWVMWQGLPLVEHVLDRIKGQTVAPTRVMISANRNLDAYQQTGHTVIEDERPGYLGPMVGIESALMRCKHPLLLVLPCDTPRIPLDLAERLHQAIIDNPRALGAYAVTADGPHPLCCMVKPAVGPSLSRSLDAGHGKIVDWLVTAGVVPVEFGQSDAFMNFNDSTTLQESSSS